MAIEWKKILTENDIIDEDSMASNLDTKVPTQQSVKAYVDANAGTDNVVRDNMMLNSIRIGKHLVLPIFNIEDGIIDVFADETGVDTVNSLNESYNSTDDYYSPSASYTNEGTGGTITHSGGYTIHTFTSDGTFNPGKQRDVEYLLIAGGGGGANGYNGGGGGGGGGGFLAGTDEDLPLTDYPIGVGDGGAVATDGEDSTFNSHTADGGGGAQHNTTGHGGGCGAGGGCNGGTGGTGTQGGNGYTSATDGVSYWYGGGGGGANASASSINGADGKSSSISGSAVTYGGGGGGGGTSGVYGTGGAGGGGRGGASGGAVAGTDGLGGGGGGQSAAGGDGVVIIRYLSETTSSNMTLISEPSEAEAEPTNARLIILAEPVDSITINTDLKGYVSLDDGSNFEQVTLVDQGNFDTAKHIYAGSEDLTDRNDKTMVWKITTHNNKDLKIYAVGLLWK